MTNGKNGQNNQKTHKKLKKGLKSTKKYQNEPKLTNGPKSEPHSKQKWDKISNTRSRDQNDVQCKAKVIVRKLEILSVESIRDFQLLFCLLAAVLSLQASLSKLFKFTVQERDKC